VVAAVTAAATAAVVVAIANQGGKHVTAMNAEN